MAQVWEYIKIALMNIRSNKGRSVLTMLGIIIGISSVIMIISIGNGIKSQVNGELNEMAGGQIVIYTDNAHNEEKIYFDKNDFEAIKDKIENVKGVTPSSTVWGTASTRKGNFDTIITAGTPDLEYYTSSPIAAGRYFSESDYDSGRKVCVLTESGARQLYGTTDVIGMPLEIDVFGTTQEFTVVGIRKDSTSAMINMGMGMMIQMEMPISTLEEGFGFYTGKFEQFYVIGASNEHLSDIAAQCVSLLERRHNVRGSGAVMVQNFNDALEQVNSVLGYITVFVVLVAAISLLVGGIGVMNIMLVSVTERTREIGIRKALGARTGSILLQFLSESAIITLMGGIIGILLGVAGASVVCSAIGFTAHVLPSTVLGASFFSSAVGIFFGIYPARKAARLSPIEALRHE